MIGLTVLLVLVAGSYVGWNIGANDAANAMGTAVGGRMIRYRQAISMIVIFVIAGAVFEGWKVMETVGTEIVTGPINNPLAQVPLLGIITLLAAGLWVTIATAKGLPVSTSQSVVGSVVGAGLLISFLEPSGVIANVKLYTVNKIVIAWVLAPVMAGLFAYLIYRGTSPLLRKIKNVNVLNRILRLLVLTAGAFVAYTLGTNDVGAAMGLASAIVGREPGLTAQMMALVGGVALAVGAVTYSKRVMQTVGTGITRLDFMTAFAAQFGAAFAVWISNQFGFPVSTTQAIIGGIVGAGLVKGTAAVSKRKLKKVAMAWVMTPLAGASLALLLGTFILAV